MSMAMVTQSQTIMYLLMVEMLSSIGENMIAFNYGEGNHLFGILIGGNPEIVVGNFIGGNLGKEFPPVIPFPS